MQVKRNQVVVVNYQNAPRLALVRSVRNSTQFYALAKSYPNYAATDSSSLKLFDC